jgi:hypothetical protein
MKIPRHLFPILLLLFTLGIFNGCAAPVIDYSHYRPYVEHMPRSILVLPPLNDSANVHASEAFLSTITAPLGELGYYVYPVSVVDRLFKENGVPVPGDMHAVSLKKIDEIFGADAVLYVHIRTWTTTYVLVDTTSSVSIEYKLVDTKTGTVIWKNVGNYAFSSSQSAAQSGGDIISMAAMAVILAQVQAIDNATSNGKYERAAAAQTNAQVFYAFHHGLLVGAHRADYAKNQEWIKAELAKADSSGNGQPPSTPATP